MKTTHVTITKHKGGKEEAQLCSQVLWGHSYETLRPFLIPESSRADKSKNRDTMSYAEALRAKLLEEAYNGVRYQA